MPRRKKAVKKKIDRWWRLPINPRFFWLVALVLIFFLILSLYNLFSLYVIKKQLNADLELIREAVGVDIQKQGHKQISARPSFSNSNLAVEAEEMPLADFELAQTSYLTEKSVQSFIQEDPLAGTLVSFGDSFSGLSYIDAGETDMFWDDNVTSFSFPPLYRLERRSSCSQIDCGFPYNRPDRFCLSGDCLVNKGNHLEFKGKELLLPPELRELEILDISLFSADDYWLIGVMTGPEESARGWVYRFDGLSFSPLITDKSDYQIKPKFGRNNGSIAFGGNADDFLILYAGYDGRAFRVRGREIEDITHFFGLRVTAGGFLPQIFRIAGENGADFYICSLTAGKPKIIKIWSKDQINSGGALDFSSVFAGADFKADRITCSMPESNKRQLMIAVEHDNSFSLWAFEDFGFDHSRSRKVVSGNIASGLDFVKAVVAADVSILSLSGFPGINASLSFANLKGRFEEASPYLWHGFSEEGADLYWRLLFRPEGGVFYSPWFNHINRLDYLLKD